MAEQDEKDKGVTVYDFYIEQKVKAFCNSYAPATTEIGADEVYTDARLRSYFQAFPRNCGDTLIPYMEELERRGWTMHTTINGEAALFCALRASKELSSVQGLL